MNENIQYAFVTKDGKPHGINISGVCTILDAAFEIASSILNGDLDIDPADIVRIEDIPG